MIRLRRAVVILCGLTLVLVAGVIAMKVVSDWRWKHLYKPATPDMRLESTDTSGGILREQWMMEGFEDEDIPVYIARPAGQGPFPAIVFMYGAGMNIQFASRFTDATTEAGFALIIPEQFHSGQRKRAGYSNLQKARAFRKRCFLTGPEMRRTIDAISALPDVDPDRIYLWGTSFGAITTARAIADEARINGIIFTLAGGDFPKFAADSPVIAAEAGWTSILARPALWLFSSLDPLHHVARFSPRPLLMQNAMHDELIPASAVESLHEAAGYPTELRWFDTSHEKITQDEILFMIDDGLRWLQDVDEARSVTRHP